MVLEPLRYRGGNLAQASEARKRPETIAKCSKFGLNSGSEAAEVLSSIIDEVSSAFVSDAFEMQSHLLGFAGVLRMLRLGRVLRLVRLVRVIPALKSMVYLCLGSASLGA